MAYVGSFSQQYFERLASLDYHLVIQHDRHTGAGRLQIRRERIAAECDANLLGGAVWAKLDALEPQFAAAQLKRRRERAVLQLLGVAASRTAG